MKPITFQGVTTNLGAPRGHNHKTQGECGSLPVMVRSGGEYVSRWTFSEDERRAIAEGADIFLSVFSGVHITQPPVMLQLSDDKKVKESQYG